MLNDRAERLVACVRSIGAKYCLSDSDTGSAIGIAWFRDMKSGYRHPIGAIARYAVWHALTGRDIPGMQTRKSDAMKVARSHGKGQWLADREGEPLDNVIAAETWERIDNALTEQQRTVFRLALKGWGTGRIARKLALSSGRISQIRRQVYEALQA